VDIINARKSYYIGKMEMPIRCGSDPPVQSTGPLPEHGTIWLGQECGVRSVKQRRSHDGVSKGICQHHRRQCACKDIPHAEKIETYKARYDEIIEYRLEINLPPQKEPGKRGRAKNGFVFILDS
jgi:hypothetical protein